MTEPDDGHNTAPYCEAFRLDTPFGPCVGISLPASGRFTNAQSEKLHPLETAHAEGLSDLRSRTYVGGRLALRAAFGVAGLNVTGPVLSGPAGEPLIPAAAWGSISHKQHLAVAVACSPSGRGALGIDIETTKPGRIDIAPRVLRPEERTSIAHLPEPERGLQTRRAFSGKEAVYKAGYPLAQQFFGFQEAQLTMPFDPAPAIFHSIVTVLKPTTWTPDFGVELFQYITPTMVISLARARGNTEIPLRNNGLHGC